MEQLTLVIPCLFGLEKLVADEARRLGLAEVRGENGRVLCRGGLKDIPRLNLNLRCGERVLIRLGSFPAESFDQLFEGTRALPWEELIPREGEFPVRGHSLNSCLHSVPACQSIVKKAVAARLGEKYGVNQLPETGARYQIQFSILKDQADLFLDTTGPGLYKRGYRAQGVEAPLRETLAAAMVQLSRYRGRDPFCDPFCGSGTIVIEAALAAKNRAPGLNRSFSAQKWRGVPSALWLEAADEAMDGEFHGSYEIWGGDIDPRAVELARHNARLAEVGDAVTGADRHFLVIDPMYYTNDMVRMVHDDFNVTLTISSVFVLIVLLLSYRSIIMALIAFLPMSLSWYIVTGCMAIFGIEFNLINIVISTFVFGIGVDYSIFITDGLLAVYRTRKPLLLHHKTAIFLSAVILVIVVASLLFAVHPAISSIGVSTLIGMGGTIVIAYTLLPALFEWLVTGRTRRGKAPVSVFNLFIPDKKKTPARRIKDNYLYKGNAVELALRTELAATRHYTLLDVMLRGQQSMLDYGCEYGFCCYWAAAAGKQVEVTGIDEKAYRITLADNCYQKTPLMRFTTDAGTLADQYDLVIINRDEPLLPPERLAALLGHARAVLIRKDIAPRYVPLLDTERFKVRTEDKVFEAYSVL